MSGKISNLWPAPALMAVLHYLILSKIESSFLWFSLFVAFLCYAAGAIALFVAWLRTFRK